MATTIVVTPGPDGMIAIGARPVAPAGVAFVPLDGVTLIVDPTDPEGLPTATVVCEDAAEQVAQLFGDEVAQALGTPEEVVVPLGDSALRDAAFQLGILTWLTQNRPLPFDAALLDLESAAVQADLVNDDQQVLTDPRRLATLVEMARRLRVAPDTPLADQISRLFVRSATHVPRSAVDALASAVHHERELVRVRDAFGSVSLTSADLSWLAEAARPPAAAHLGDDEGPREAKASIDWLRVPSAMLPATENSVRFSIAGGEVEVAVPAPQQAIPHPAVPRQQEPDQPVVASLRSFSWPVPLASGELRFDEGADEWRGRFPLTEEAAGLARRAKLLDVDVRAARVPWAAPNRRRQREAAARRWAARGWALKRINVVAQRSDVDAAARASLGYSARLWGPSDAEASRLCRAVASAIPRGPLTLAEQWLVVSGVGLP